MKEQPEAGMPALLSGKKLSRPDAFPFLSGRCIFRRLPPDTFRHGPLCFNLKVFTDEQNGTS